MKKKIIARFPMARIAVLSRHVPRHSRSRRSRESSESHTASCQDARRIALEHAAHMYRGNKKALLLPSSICSVPPDQVTTDECTTRDNLRDVAGIGFVLANMTSALILAFEECRFEVGFTTPEFRGGSILQSARVRAPLSRGSIAKRLRILPLHGKRKKRKGCSFEGLFFFFLIFFPLSRDIFNYLLEHSV